MNGHHNAFNDENNFDTARKKIDKRKKGSQFDEFDKASKAKKRIEGRGERGEKKRGNDIKRDNGQYIEDEKNFF